MKLAIEINSYKFKVNSYEEVKSRIGQLTSGILVGEDFKASVYRDVIHLKNDKLILYRFTKFNKKSSQTQVIEQDGRNITTSKVIRKPYWEVEYIIVPRNIVDTVYQYNRHFDLKLRIKS